MTIMITARRSAKSPPTSTKVVLAPLPLQNGDRLTAAEFLRRLMACPMSKKQNSLTEPFI